jgi:hypothetical protein
MMREQAKLLEKMYQNYPKLKFKKKKLDMKIWF